MIKQNVSTGVWSVYIIILLTCLQINSEIVAAMSLLTFEDNQVLVMRLILQNDNNFGICRGQSPFVHIMFCMSFSMKFICSNHVLFSISIGDLYAQGCWFTFCELLEAWQIIWLYLQSWIFLEIEYDIYCNIHTIKFILQPKGASHQNPLLSF